MRRAVVVGAGLSGIAAAVTVARSGAQTVHVAPRAPADRRTSALMQPSVRWMQSMGLVGDPASLGVPLTQIRIIDATDRLIRAPEALFDSHDIGEPAFGWNFPNSALLAAFDAARATLPAIRSVEASLTGLERRDGLWHLALSDGTTIETDLVVGSDGKKSFVRAAAGFRASETGFVEAALVCDLDLARPLGGASVEFHYPRGPFTLVPAGGNRANLVWIDDRDKLKALQAQGPEALRAAFLDRSQRLFGDIRLLTPAHMFLLSRLSVPEAGQHGVVLAGEAAHAFPPIGAQGLNLGLRDVADLGAALAAAGGDGATWADTVSADYSARRSGDLQGTGGMVDALFRSLLSDFLPSQAMRAGGLWALRTIPALRRQAFALGMGAR